MVLSGSGYLTFVRQKRQKSSYFCLAHLLRVLLIVEDNEAIDPINVRLFGSVAHMPETHRLSYLVQQFGFLSHTLSVFHSIYGIIPTLAVFHARSGGRSIGIGPFDNGEFSLDLIGTSYATDSLVSALDGVFHYGWLSDSIGYIHIGRFRDPEASADVIDAALRDLEGVSGLVVDVRHNGGGNDRAGQAIASRLVVKPHLYMTVAMRKIGQVPPTFAAPVEWWLKPAGPKQYTGPVVLLVNSRSISAAENFALAMRAAPHALVMGETTAGVMADAATQPLPNGWEVGVPVNVFRDANGVSWEGAGVMPDLWVKNTQADVEAGQDRVLETAVDFLRAGAVQPHNRSAQEPTARQGSN